MLLKPSVRQAIIVAHETGKDATVIGVNAQELGQAQRDSLSRLDLTGDLDAEPVLVPEVDELGLRFVERPGWVVTVCSPEKPETGEWTLYLLRNGKLYIEGCRRGENGDVPLNINVSVHQLAMQSVDNIEAILDGFDGLGVHAKDSASNSADFDK